MTFISRAFSLIELLIVIAIIALLVSILLPALSAGRRAARMSLCISNMQQTGRAHSTYAADFHDFLGALNGLPQYQLQVYNPHWDNSLRAYGEQAFEILRQHNVTVEQAFIPNGDNIKVITEEHNHLALAGYLGEKIPTVAAVCPEDRPRLDWQRNPEGIEQSAYKPKRLQHAQLLSWLPLSSSYQLMPAGWMTNKWVPRNGNSPFEQGVWHFLYNYTKGEELGKRKLNEVSFPAQKVAVADSQQRHFGRDMYYAFINAQQPLLFWDGSASVRRTGDGNKGWNRINPSKPETTSFVYAADAGFESLPPAGSFSQVVTAKIPAAYYKWTRGGLAGVDFGGSEINTSKW